MSIEQLSPNLVVSNPAQMNPQVRADQATALPQASQDAERVTQAIRTDTVTISPQALQKLASDGDGTDPETKETVAEKNGEVRREKR